MSVISDARDAMVTELYSLEPGSTEKLNQAQVIKILSYIELSDRKHEFEVEKEETRKVEKSNEYVYSEYDRQLRKIDLGIRLLDVILNPGASLLRTFANNRVRIQRDEMGYHFEEHGVVGSHTFNNSQRDKYD